MVHGDSQEAAGHLVHVLGGRAGEGGVDSGGHGLEAGAHRRRVEGLVHAGPEHGREELGPELAQHHVHVGHGQAAAAPRVARRVRGRAAAPVAGRARVGAGGLGPDSEALPVKGQERPATRRHGVDVHHGAAHAHAGHLFFRGGGGATEMCGGGRMKRRGGPGGSWLAGWRQKQQKHHQHQHQHHHHHHHHQQQQQQQHHHHHHHHLFQNYQLRKFSRTSVSKARSNSPR